VYFVNTTEYEVLFDFICFNIITTYVDS